MEAGEHCLYRWSEEAVGSGMADGGGGLSGCEGARREGRGLQVIMASIRDKAAHAMLLCVELATCASSAACRRTWRGGVDDQGGRESTRGLKKVS